MGIEIYATRPSALGDRAVRKGDIILRDERPEADDHVRVFLTKYLRHDDIAVRTVGPRVAPAPDLDARTVEAAEADLQVVPGIGPEIAAAIVRTGVTSRHQLAVVVRAGRDGDKRRLVAIPGVNTARLREWAEVIAEQLGEEHATSAADTAEQDGGEA